MPGSHRTPEEDILTFWLRAGGGENRRLRARPSVIFGRGRKEEGGYEEEDEERGEKGEEEEEKKII